jgi:glycosyltransferase involved in cell wall biosynthesis
METESGTVYSVSVVVPVYDSAAILPDLVERLKPVLESLGRDFETIFVNDASRDRSWQVIQQLARQHAWIRGLNLMRNYGQHNALLCGIRAARHDVVVTMDDDLQHPPEELPKLLAKMQEGFEVVYGFPQRQQHGFLRDIASELSKLALRGSLGAETARHVSAFRAFRTQAREAFANYHSPFVSIDVVLSWATTRFVAIKVRHDPRPSGVSNYTFRKLFTHAMNMMTGFSVLPLQLANLMGFLCTAFGGLVLLFVVGRFLFYGTSVSGFTFLASTIAIFAGAQLLALGVIGEYLARMHFRMMERPTYTIREEIGQAHETVPIKELVPVCPNLPRIAALSGKQTSR